MLYVEFFKFDALEFLIFFLFFCSCEILVGGAEISELWYFIL